MAGKSRGIAESVQDVLRSWGLELWPASGQRSSRSLKLYLPLDAERRLLIGELTQEPGEYVYRYTDEFRSQEDYQPLHAFPDVFEEYRSPELFAFFQARIPPIERPDVKRALADRRIEAGDTLGILAAVSRRSVSSPYEFELSGEVQ